MEQIKEFSSINSLVSAHMLKGVLTNTFISAEEYKAEIDAGTLYAHRWQGGLIILRKRSSYNRVNFYIKNLDISPDVNLEGTTVMEIPLRPKDAGKEATLINYWSNLGFNHSFSRLRLERPKGQAFGETPEGFVSNATEQDINLVLEHMYECFDHVTGCLPTVHELEADIREGCVLCIKTPSGEISGVIHFKTGPALSQIRHLSVSASARGQGLAGKLLTAYLSKTGWCRALVWTGQQNNSALSVYKKHGYELDGWKSAVLTKR